MRVFQSWPCYQMSGSPCDAGPGLPLLQDQPKGNLGITVGPDKHPCSVTTFSFGSLGRVRYSNPQLRGPRAWGQIQIISQRTPIPSPCFASKPRWRPTHLARPGGQSAPLGGLAGWTQKAQVAHS